MISEVKTEKLQQPIARQGVIKVCVAFSPGGKPIQFIPRSDKKGEECLEWVRGLLKGSGATG